MDIPQLAQNFLGAAAAQANWAVSLLSLALALISLVISWQVTRTERINNNSWETYRIYTVHDIERSRTVVRAVAKDPAWQNVKSLAAYTAYFHLDARVDDTTAPPHRQFIEQLHRNEQDLHNLLNVYHQVGLLLNRGLLDTEFTMRLLGAGLEDRWPVVGRVPSFYPDDPYQGMYMFYDRYNRWKAAQDRRKKWPILRPNQSNRQRAIQHALQPTAAAPAAAPVAAPVAASANQPGQAQ